MLRHLSGGQGVAGDSFAGFQKMQRCKRTSAGKQLAVLSENQASPQASAHGAFLMISDP